MRKYLLCLVLSCLLSAFGTVSAQEPERKEESIDKSAHNNEDERGHAQKHEHGNQYQAGSLSGSIQIGAFLENTDSQLKADSKNATITALDRKADAFNIIEPFILLELIYNINAGKSFYVRTPFEDDEYGLALGGRRGLPEEGILDLSLFYGLFDEVWEDPYITNLARKETDMTQIGSEFKYENIAGTPLNIGYKYRFINIDKDLIGEKFNGDLKRGGNIHTGSIGYELISEKGHRLTPELKYTSADMDGKSNSYNEYAVKLRYGKMSERYMLELSVSGGTENYDKKHPLFDKVRKDNKYKSEVMFVWLKPFGAEKYFVTIAAEIEHSDSNIDFLDSRTFACFTMLGYEL